MKSDMQFKIGDIVVIFKKESKDAHAFKVGDEIRVDYIDQRDNTIYCMDVERGLSQWVAMSEVKHAPTIGETRMTEIEKSIIQNITMANIRATLTMDTSFDKKMQLILDYIQNYEQIKERELLKDGIPQ